jgi:hypothetical protein
MTDTFTATAKLWIWQSDKGAGNWHFLTIEGEVAEALHALTLMRRLEFGAKRGWGAMKVRAQIGETRWDTSIFPEKDGGGWLLPVKAAVRNAEGLVAGDVVEVTVVV